MFGGGSIHCAIFEVSKQTNDTMKALNQLQQRIHATNFLNKERAKILKEIEAEFKAMDGIKVQLASGEQSAKWTLKGDHFKTTKTINGEKTYLSFQWFFVFSYSYVQLRTKVCINGGSYDVRPATAFTQYVETTDYVGRLQEQHLEDTDEIEKCIENALQEVANPLNEKKFLKHKAKYQKALNTVNKLKDETHYKLRDFLPKH